MSPGMSWILRYAPHLGFRSLDTPLFLASVGSTDPMAQIAFIASLGFAGVQDPGFQHGRGGYAPTCASALFRIRTGGRLRDRSLDRSRSRTDDLRRRTRSEHGRRPARPYG